MNSRQIRREFRKFWAMRCTDDPAYKTDKPAMRQAFSVFVDDLAKDGRITERVAFNATLTPAKYGCEFVWVRRATK
jgi:hypothetical protein